MSTPAFDFFLEFGAYCFENHPPELWMNASTLIRTGVVGPGYTPSPRSLGARLRQRVGLEGRVLSTLLRRLRHPSIRPAAPVSVLCFMPFGRRDHEGLVLPYLRQLAEGGVRCAVVTPRPQVDTWARLLAHDGTIVTPVVTDTPKSVLRDSRVTLTALQPGLRDIASRFGMNTAARRQLEVYFEQFALEKALASGLIERLEPQVVFGLHFVSNRGWQAAMARASSSGRRLTAVLVQHGTFEATRGFHDFEGADLVMLWGQRWRRELQRYASLPFRPVPAAVVTGNPKYDDRDGLVNHAAAQPPKTMRELGHARVLYVSTHVSGKTLVPPLRLALKASEGPPGFEIAVKPHPAEADGVLRTLINGGDLRAASVLPSGDTLQACVPNADVVVGPESTALFDAARLGKPVVLLSETPTPAFNGFLTAVDAGALHTSVRRLTSDAGWLEEVLGRQSRLLGDAFGTIPDPVSAGVAQIRKLI